MSVDILNQVNQRYAEAVEFHACAIHLYRFLSLEGFCALHKYQMLTEQIKQLEVSEFIITTYHVMPKEIMQKPTEPYLKGKHRLKLTPTDVWECMKQHFKDYRAFESENLSFYERCASELSKSNDIVGELYVKEICKEVHKELIYVTDLYLEYIGMDFDLPQIIGDQTEIKERFQYLQSTMFGTPIYSHHWNGDYFHEKRGLRNDG